MTHPLSHTPVAKAADRIFASVAPGNVLLLEADMGSGKSLYTPIEVQRRLDGHVLVLVPSVDVARTNAKLIAQLSGHGWKVGHEVGYCAGGKYVPGTHVTIATYGAFIARRNLRQQNNVGILLDESHAEIWEVEVARADILAELKDGANIFVAELSATMDAHVLTSYWELHGRDNVSHQQIEGAGTEFERTMLERRCFSQAEEQTKLVEITLERLALGDRSIMVTQPGLFEVETLAERLSEAFADSGDSQLPEEFDLYTYHSDTDPEDVRDALSPLSTGEVRVLVTTPRLLTGMNMTLNTIITDGVAKYPTTDNQGSVTIRRDNMSQTELKQALGRVGRTQDGRLILCSRTPMTLRQRVMTPEVMRGSSLPLALSLLAIGRNPLAIDFCHQPQNLKAAMCRLKELGFVDGAGALTHLGREAHQLDVRPDLARFVLQSIAGDVTPDKLAYTLITAAVAEVGGVTKRRLNDSAKDMLEVLDPEPSSMLFGEVKRFLLSLTLGKKDRKTTTWLSRRDAGRVKGVLYRLIDKLDDERLYSFFKGINEPDREEIKMVKKGKKKGPQTVKISPSRNAWRRVGTTLGQSDQASRSAKQQWICHLGPTNVHVVHQNRHNGQRLIGCSINDPDGTQIDAHTSVILTPGGYFLAQPKLITPKHGGRSFCVLSDITKVTPEELATTDPVTYQVSGSELLVDGKILAEPIEEEDDDWNNWGEAAAERSIEELFADI